MKSRASVAWFLALCILVLTSIGSTKADDKLRKKDDNRLTVRFHGLPFCLLPVVHVLISYARHVCQQRETIIENHERRRDRLEDLLQEAKERITDHEAGRNLLDGEEYEKLAKRVGLYERKLEKMREPLDERDIERRLERERMRADRYSNFEL
eukprot:scaffold672_cov126-Cylindrotheca_fusiformis.AAC.49